MLILNSINPLRVNPFPRIIIQPCSADANAIDDFDRGTFNILSNLITLIIVRNTVVN